MNLMKTPRPGRISFEEYGLLMAEVIALRGTCARRRVGCLLVDSQQRELSTGRNGPPTGVQNCITVPCPGSKLPSGTGLDVCQAVHAEANALMRCPDIREARYCFVTHSPCVHCVKMLMNSGVMSIIFRERYAHDEEAQQLWTTTRGQHYKWIHLPRDEEGWA
jgi:dCMP deaminase